MSEMTAISKITALDSSVQAVWVVVYGAFWFPDDNCDHSSLKYVNEALNDPAMRLSTVLNQTPKSIHQREVSGHQYCSLFITTTNHFKQQLSTHCSEWHIA